MGSEPGRVSVRICLDQIARAECGVRVRDTRGHQSEIQGVVMRTGAEQYGFDLRVYESCLLASSDRLMLLMQYRASVGVS
jgi:hypothetical protein